MILWKYVRAVIVIKRNRGQCAGRWRGATSDCTCQEGEDSHGIVMDAFPWDGRLGWTIQEFGPSSGTGQRSSEVKIDTSCLFAFHGRLIHREQKKRLRQKGEVVCLGDSAITEYKFTENYYLRLGR